MVIITSLFFGCFFGSHSFSGQSLLLSTTVLNDSYYYVYAYVGSGHPTGKDISTCVIPHIPPDKWEDLGLQLLDGDTGSTELSHIKASNPDTSQRCKVMFDKWLCKRNATWNELITALEKVHLTFLADNVKKILSPTTAAGSYNIYVHT